MNWPVIKKTNLDTVNINDHTLMNGTSNDYLGLSQHPDLKSAITNAVMTHGVGSTGSRRLSGNHQSFLDTESCIAQWVGTPAGVMFNSGFQMNSGIFSAITNTRTLVVADKYIHASLLDGIRQSPAQLVRFRHNDTDHLSHVLKKYAHQYSEVIIVCESIYSMDGDVAPIHQIIQLKHAYNAKLIVDEAHSIGLYGHKGNGWINRHNCLQDVDILLVTFGKSFGLSGAMMLTTQSIAAQVKTNCRAYIYSTALPIPLAIGIQAACTIIQHSDPLRRKLASTIRQFKSIISTSSNTQIQPIIFEQNTHATVCEQILFRRGFFVRAIHHPTVPKGQSRLRITLTATHTAHDACELANHITECKAIHP